MYTLYINRFELSLCWQVTDAINVVVSTRVGDSFRSIHHHCHPIQRHQRHCNPKSTLLYTMIIITTIIIIYVLHLMLFCYHSRAYT